MAIKTYVKQAHAFRFRIKCNGRIRKMQGQTPEETYVHIQTLLLQVLLVSNQPTYSYENYESKIESMKSGLHLIPSLITIPMVIDMESAELARHIVLVLI